MFGVSSANSEKMQATSRPSRPYIVQMAKKKKARVLSSRVAYRGPAFWVTTDQVLEPSGVRARRDIVHHTGSVVVLAVDDTAASQRFCCCGNIAMPPSNICGSFARAESMPAKAHCPLPSANCWRKLAITAKHWKRIFEFYASPGFVAETMAVYLARGLRAGQAQPEEDEVIETRFFPLRTAVKMVMRKYDPRCQDDLCPIVAEPETESGNHVK